MVAPTTYSNRPSWFGWFTVAAILAVTLFATSSLGTYAIAGRDLIGMKGWPQPIGWIAQVLVIESWPTYRTVEIRWLAWALGAVGLLILAAWNRRPTSATASIQAPLFFLGAVSTVLVALVAVRASLAAVPIVGLIWTWQLALALIWMMVLYVWTLRLSVQTITRAMALSVTGLCAVSLLYCIQGRQAYPNWPTGNVLLLTTACLAGVFLLGTWAYCLWTTAQATAKRGDYLQAVIVTGLLGLVAVVLSMAGRRAGVLGLAGGGAFVAIMAMLRRADLRLSVDPSVLRRTKWLIVAVVAASVVAGGLAIPRLLKGGRWQTVQYRVEMYRAGILVFLDQPLAPLIGVGPGHLGFDLTSLMRPLHAESPRLFHGEVTSEVHSEPLQAIVELGLPLGLLYLALPLGGLYGYARAYRKTDDPSGRLAILGAGASLAAALAAEATSVGMRNPDVAVLVWALTGVGWACGARVGAFTQLAQGMVRPRLTGILSTGKPVFGIAGIVGGAAVTVFAWQGVRAGANLLEASVAWDSGQVGQAYEKLAGWPVVPAGSSWMTWKYLQGRACLSLAAKAQDRSAATGLQAEGLSSLAALVGVCPAYQDAPVWLGRATGDPDKLRALCEDFANYDPYNYEARLTEASLPGTGAVEQITALRLAIRNTSINAQLAGKVLSAAEDPAVKSVLDSWMADAREALLEPDPARWTDPLALESVRLAIVLAGQEEKFAEALDLSNQAATLLKYLAGDPWRNRLETVAMEVYLNQAWFGWLVRPEAARSCLSVLDGHLKEIVQGPAGSFSERMAAQFLGMLQLSVGHDKEAWYALYIASSRSSWQDLERQAGVAYARLVALLDTETPAERVGVWTQRGKRALGEDLWNQILERWRPVKAAPWWYGVLSE